MAQSSDELIKREIFDFFRHKENIADIRIFPQSSRDDQKRFGEGGLTFGLNGTLYGSCDVAWTMPGTWIDRYDMSEYPVRPILALEATDALNRGSSGNAQYQRFHHALGAVRNNIVGVYYFRKGIDVIQPDLYGMAVSASKLEECPYIVTDDLNEVHGLLNELFLGDRTYTNSLVTEMEIKFRQAFEFRYKSDWHNFAAKRSSIIFPDMVIKYAARNSLNFTNSSQRAGHIAVGEMYLTRFLFPDYPILYLFARMLRTELNELDRTKSADKEWSLLRNEPGVTIKTLDDVEGITPELKNQFISVKDLPLKGKALSVYKDAASQLHFGLLRKEFIIR